MARTKQTFKGNPLNPPEDLLCGICGFGAKKGQQEDAGNAEALWPL